MIKQIQIQDQVALQVSGEMMDYAQRWWLVQLVCSHGKLLPISYPHT